MLGKTRRVKCPDGRIVRVFKNPEDAFPILVRDISLRLQGDVAVASEIAGQLKADLSTTARTVATELDEVNRSMQSTFRSIYIVYQHDPCRQGDYLAEEVRKANEREHELRRVSVALMRLRDLVGSGATDIVIKEMLRDVLGVLREEETREIESEMEQTTRRALEWDREP